MDPFQSSILDKVQKRQYVVRVNFVSKLEQQQTWALCNLVVNMSRDLSQDESDQISSQVVSNVTEGLAPLHNVSTWGVNDPSSSIHRLSHDPITSIYLVTLQLSLILKCLSISGVKHRHSTDNG